ncbi:hypothetical protein XELAEV_18004206mg [Xenopus laevis]|uniref:Uncharacterized protein n=1 Tax=Xenopus laevis TaxID=8355 RepID=A0A974BPM9_XENLA|nr:hypothetical protein XELAEV_18004206mg [Xenopus laevis]
MWNRPFYVNCVIWEGLGKPTQCNSFHNLLESVFCRPRRHLTEINGYWIKRLPFKHTSFSPSPFAAAPRSTQRGLVIDWSAAPSISDTAIGLVFRL